MRGLSFRLLLVLCLLASTAQGFIAQTHVHAPPMPVASAGQDAAVLDALAAGQPACALCDVAGHSPAIAPPVQAPGLPLPPAASSAPRFEAASDPAIVASHHWRGRAPPHV